jgi:selenocysteine-specific elongation factor
VHRIIGTAGHIDHGKTSLVKALTGVDTDRLKEEKERGISIDLGFASFQLPDGSRAGVVDVPGHERFIKNMLAGAHGIDLVLFTVAADDGVMPQTEEHLDIVHLLGVRRGVFVVTKADLASQARVADVTDEIRTLVAGTALEGSPIVPFSAITGEGLDQVRETIVRVLAQVDRQPAVGRFRLPVDRAFLSSGHGLIVTGTAISGTVRPGDKLRCLPAGDVLRVRSVEVHGEPVEVAEHGQRIALNLTGWGQALIARGDVIGDETLTLVSSRFDAVVEVRPSVARGLKNHQRVRVHLGTAERIGKIIPLGWPGRPAADVIPAGDRAYCQVSLLEPIAAMRGDHFILRDETAQRTLAGGWVLLPDTPRRKRTDASLLPTLETLHRGDDTALLEAVVTDSDTFAVPLWRLSQLLNDTDARAIVRAEAASGLHRFAFEGDTHYASAARCARVQEQLLGLVRAWHAERPLSSGLDIEEARARLTGVAPPPRMLRALVEALERDRALVREGNVLRLPSHRIQVSGGDQAIVDRIVAALGASPLAPPDVKQLCDDIKIDRNRLLTLLRAMEKQHQVVAVSPDLYFTAAVIERVREELVHHLAGGGALTPATFRDRYQTSRKYTIPILEFFDRQGVTIRIGESRRLKQTAKKS